MKTNVTILDRKFHVNEKKKVVTCVITANCNIIRHPAYLFIAAIFNKYDAALPSNLRPENLYSNFTFSATAKCSSLDEFDETKGMRIAESRAKAKAFKFYEEQYHKCMKALVWAGLKLNESYLACAYTKTGELEHIKDLLK